ncbi:MAG: UDP-N-acetylmuramate dehydrogenase [Synergistaceae bacterium]|nr:UDP-N-acetylmuramate dehydrogenase [Synergistaceae bacterium]
MNFDLVYNQPLAPLTSLRTGGYAEIFASPDTPDALGTLISSCRHTPVQVLGGGSNIIVPDGTVSGLTVSLGKMASFRQISRCTAEIGAGYPLPKLLKTLRTLNLGGLEFAVGIPGTAGGAFLGNAGAGGHGFCELVDTVTALDSSGQLITLERGQFTYGYRYCSLREMIVISMVMTFRDFEPEDAELLEFYRDKRRNQPVSSRSAGCTFKNPEGHSAGKLLDECGCKGLSIGGAKVSEQHANFIINTGNASSSDVNSLIDLCAKKVYDSTGIILEREIKTLSPCFYTR